MVCAGWPRFTLFSIFCFPTTAKKINEHENCISNSNEIVVLQWPWYYSEQTDLLRDVPQANCAILCSWQKYISRGMCSQSPNRPIHVSIHQDVTRRVLLTYFDDLCIPCPHKDFTLRQETQHITKEIKCLDIYSWSCLTKRCCTFPLHTERTQSMICPVSNRKALQRFNSWSQSFRAPPSFDLQRKPFICQLWFIINAHLQTGQWGYTINKLLGHRHCQQITYGLSLPPVTIRPSLRVVYMVNTGPVWALATILTRMCSFHTHTSPLMVPVNVKLFWKENKFALI